jgi:hypothetical protein
VIVGLEVFTAYYSIYGNKAMEYDIVCDIGGNIIALTLHKGVLSLVLMLCGG